MELNPNIIQTSPKGREFRLSAISKDESKPAKWIRKEQKYCWIVRVIFLDNREFKVLIIGLINLKIK